MRFLRIPNIGEPTALEAEAVALRDAGAERLRLSGELAERDRAMTAARNRLDFLGTASGLATSGDGDLTEAARVLVEKERSRADAEAALTGFDAANGNLHGRGVALQERRKALARKIAEHQWRKDWLTLLPDLEKVLIRLAELQSRAWREELTIRGVMPSAIGIPFDLRPDNRETTPEDIRKVMRFQAALFGDDVPVMAQGGVYPSSLRIGWWRGF